MLIGHRRQLGAARDSRNGRTHSRDRGLIGSGEAKGSRLFPGSSLLPNLSSG
jgi:hypothetical protein